MKLFALSDPHLSFSNPEKKMDRFGDIWVDHPLKIKQHWVTLIKSEDIVVIPGDISWARRFEQALNDLHWLHQLPGTKVLLRGNHDFWWPKSNKLRSNIPDSIHIIQNNCVTIGPFSFFGSRLWDTEEYSCESLVDWDPTKCPIQEKATGEALRQQEKIYDRELHRLNLSIESLPDQTIPIGLSHYPPINGELSDSRAAKLYESTNTQHVIFGHLHSLLPNIQPFGTRHSTTYHLTACDYLSFKPKLIAEA